MSIGGVVGLRGMEAVQDAQKYAVEGVDKVFDQAKASQAAKSASQDVKVTSLAKAVNGLGGELDVSV